MILALKHWLVVNFIFAVIFMTGASINKQLNSPATPPVVMAQPSLAPNCVIARGLAEKLKACVTDTNCKPAQMKLYAEGLVLQGCDKP